MLDEFAERIRYEENSTCWLWKGCINPNGYGQFNISGKMRGSHRVSYELYKGKIPEGLVIDHLCRVRHCVNPEHLEAVTNQENCLRGISHQSLKTHCPHGHEYNKINTFIDKKGYRKCIECDRIGQRQRYHKRNKTIQ